MVDLGDLGEELEIEGDGPAESDVDEVTSDVEFGESWATALDEDDAEKSGRTAAENAKQEEERDMDEVDFSLGDVDIDEDQDENLINNAMGY